VLVEHRSRHKKLWVRPAVLDPLEGLDQRGGDVYCKEDCRVRSRVDIDVPVREPDASVFAIGQASTGAVPETIAEDHVGRGSIRAVVVATHANGSEGDAAGAGDLAADMRTTKLDTCSALKSGASSRVVTSRHSGIG
jgi:hypothetical protein